MALQTSSNESDDMLKYHKKLVSKYKYNFIR